MTRTIAAALFALLAFTAPAHATTINFDDITDSVPFPDATAIPNGYQGLNWNNFYVDNTQLPSVVPSGYKNGVVLSPNVALNGFGTPASFSAVTPFSFTGRDFTAAWYDNLSVTLTGSLGGVQKYNDTLALNTSSPLFVGLNWTDIDTVTLSSTGGTDHGFSDPSIHGTQVVLDNLQVSAAPLPAALPIFGAGLLALGAFGWRKSRGAKFA
jgi:hypothetical protein